MFEFLRVLIRSGTDNKLWRCRSRACTTCLSVPVKNCTMQKGTNASRDIVCWRTLCRQSELSAVLDLHGDAINNGFPPHPHRDMEISAYLRKGAITREDSLGNLGRMEAGDVQMMSAGKGIPKPNTIWRRTRPETFRY
jgi:hypothetical protein